MEPIIIGESTPIENLRVFIKKTALSDANVLLMGETGVGKELAAKMIHSLSARSGEPFIQINSANLNENLLESELFGHKKGAYTGAYFDRLGLIEEAQGGIFFFDEIGDISPYLQAKLLEVVERKRMRRLGENEYREINVRYIFATNRDLQSLAEKGKFRQDLFYRINILAYSILPLREKREDIPLLIERALRELNTRNHGEKRLSSRALNALMKYDYPGNVRELESIVERSYIFAENNRIKLADLFLHSDRLTRRVRPAIDPGAIKQELRKCQGNKTKAAKRLGISRQWLYKLIKKNRV